MSNVSFAELFGGYIGDLKELLGCGEVAECNLDSETRILTVKIHFSKYVKKAIIDEAIRRIKQQLMLTAADFTYDFPSDKFCPSACADIAEILRVGSCQFNGFLDSAKYSLKDNVLSIDLAHGGIETLNNLEFCIQSIVSLYAVYCVWSFVADKCLTGFVRIPADKLIALARICNKCCRTVVVYLDGNACV